MRHLRTPALRKKRRKKIIFRASFFIFLFLFVFGLPAMLLRIPSIRLTEIQIAGTKTISENEIRDFINNEISKKYLYVYPKSNAILLPGNKIEKSLLSNFKKIKNVNVSLSSFHSILVTIEERVPFAVWCQSEVSEDCFLIDENGLIFDKSSISSKSLFFVFYGGDLKNNPIGDYVLSSDIFRELKLFRDGVNNFGLIPKEIKILDKNQFDLELNGGGSIFFELNDSSEHILSNLGSVLTDTSLLLVSDGKLRVSAVDLRYGNKVIIKK